MEPKNPPSIVPAPASGTSAIVVRGTPPARASYLEYRDDLRRDFHFACAYCSLTEAEARGIGFHIDHFVPQAADPALVHAYTNLMYACQKCNLFKGDYHPNAEQAARGYRVIRIDHEDPRTHLAVSDVRMRALTTTGEFNIERLELNRQDLRRVRELRKRLWDAAGFIAHGVSELLRIGVDSIPQTGRLTLIRIRQDLEGRAEHLAKETEEFVRQLARSPLLDADPEQAARTKARRAYLKDISAIGPQIPLPRPPRSRKRGTRRRAKGRR